jgi:ABC-2 type transport system ATP-binding protein
MAMLLGLVRPAAGSGTVLGDPIDQPAAYLPRVGAMVESPAFYPALTGVENLRMFATVAGHDTDRIPALLEIVSLGERGGDRYRTYSLGMKQRLGIAAALLGDPALLILDEPANGLDPQGVHEMRGLIGSLAHSGRTVLVSSHDLSELEQVCDWLVLIDAGRLVYQGPAGEFIGSGDDALSAVPEHTADIDVLAAVLRSAGHRADVVDDHVVVRDDDLAGRDLAAAVNRTAHHDGIVLVELSPVRSSLEDRYLALVRTTEQGGTR